MRAPFSILLAVFGVMFLAQAGAQPVPLGGLANVALVDEVSGDGVGGWTDQGVENSLSGFPVGEVDFDGVRFQFPQKKEPAAIAFTNFHRDGMPSEVTIPVPDLQAKMLYLLSACAWEFESGQEVAQVVIRHADGTTQTQPLVYERHTGPWWMPAPLGEASVAWRGENGQGLPIGVYLTWIPLRNHSTPIESIAILSKKNRGMFLLLGMTLSEDTSPRVRPEPLWRQENLSTDSWRTVPPLYDTGGEACWAVDLKQFEQSRWLAAELAPPLRDIPSAEASKIARWLRLLGYTAVRLPSLETILPPVDVSATKGVDPASRESIAGLHAAMRAEGLGVMLTLGGGRLYGEDDGVAAYRQINPLLANQILVDERALGLMLDTAELAGDLKPFAVSLFSTTMLLGDYDALFTVPHRNKLLNAWNKWVAERYKSGADLSAAWQVADQPSPLGSDENLSRMKIRLLNIFDHTPFLEKFRPRFTDQLEFLEDFHGGRVDSLLADVHKLFPDAEIFYSGLVVSSPLADFEPRLALRFDGIEQRLPDARMGRSPDGSPYFWNESPFRLASHWFYRPAFNRIAGKPFVAVDHAASWPGDFEFARLLLTMAIGGLQGWEGIIHRSLSVDSFSVGEAGLAAGGLAGNPAFLAVLPLGRSLFLKGDLAQAPVVWSRALDSPSFQRQHGFPALPVSIQPALLAGSVEATPDASSNKEEEILSTLRQGSVSRIESPGGHLRCDWDTDRLVISTASTLAVAGSGPDTVSVDKVSLGSLSPYGVCYATALDDRSLSSSKAILLGAVGRTRNTGQRVDVSTDRVGLHERAWRLDSPGSAPVLMEPVGATFRIEVEDPGSWTLQPLNLLGQPIGEPLQALKSQNGVLSVDFNNARSPLYLLSHEEVP